MDPWWIIAAFIFGAASSRIGLPPLVGYLIAGFVLNSIGVEGGEILSKIADIGVTLLLFTIGLKLKLKGLARPEVWGGALFHMLFTIAFFGIGLRVLGILGLPHFHLLSWKTSLLIAFALSFSSTVFAVKALEQNKEIGSRHGATAIGILIMQDVIAVIFLASSVGKLPSPWAGLLVLSLFAIRPLAMRFIGRCGHGELLMLFGILMTAAGYSGFELVGLKGDLGALVFGMLVSSHPKASELAERLLSFKDLFLVGFFINIGISGSLTLSGLVIGISAGTGRFTENHPCSSAFSLRFKLRARIMRCWPLSSLGNYSEFGLIVGAIGVSHGWISGDWLVTIAIALSISFIFAAPLNSAAHRIYSRFSSPLKRFESPERLPEDRPIDSGDAEIAIIGMGGVGTSAYDEMQRRHGNVVIGVDFASETVAAHQKKGRNVVYGDAEDSDFWERVEPGNSSVRVVMLALPEQSAAVFAVRQMRQRGFQGEITASVRYNEDIKILIEEGINAAYSLYEEAGVGFADHVCAKAGYCEISSES